MKNVFLVCALLAVGFVTGYSIHPENKISEIEPDPLPDMPRGGGMEAVVSANEPVNDEGETEPDQAVIVDAGSATVIPALQELSPAVFQDVLLKMEDYIQQEMLMAMMASDPLTALDFIQNNCEDPLFETLIHEWMRTDPVATYEWMRSNQANIRSDIFDDAQSSALISMASLHPLEAIRYVNDLKDGDAREMVYRNIAAGYARQDPEAAFDWLERLGGDLSVSQQCLAGCYHEAMSVYAISNPENAALILQDLQSPMLKERLCADIAVGLARTDISQAVKWLNSLESSSGKMAGWGRLLEAAASNAEQGQIVNLFLDDPGLMDPSSAYWRDIMVYCADLNPERTVEVYDQIPESGKPLAAELLIHAWLLEEDGVGHAEQWLSQQPSGEAYDLSASLLAVEMINERKDPSKALIWAGQIADNNARAASLRYIVGKMKVDELGNVRDCLDVIQLTDADKRMVAALLDQRIEDDFAAMILP